MAEDFRIQVEADLDTSKAEQKLNALLNEKRQIKLDIALFFLQSRHVPLLWNCQKEFYRISSGGGCKI